MNQDWYSDVMEFHKAFNCHIGTSPSFPPNDIRELRDKLEDEETRELDDADAFDNLPEVADAITDLIYVLIGRAISYGIDLRPIWDEVHKSNMNKLGGGKRADGKHLKPEGWKPPDIENLLKAQGWQD
jgi:predicted HAD superfamily Cof-like phosphohydrolase